MHLCSGTIRAPQAEEKLSVGFEFEKQMKKFNDVELRCRALPTASRPRAGRPEAAARGCRMDFAEDKTAFKPKSRWDRYFVLLVSPHVVGSARAASPTYVGMNHADFGNSNCRRNFHLRRSLTLNFARRRRFFAITCSYHRSRDTSRLFARDSRPVDAPVVKSRRKKEAKSPTLK